MRHFVWLAAAILVAGCTQESSVDTPSATTGAEPLPLGDRVVAMSISDGAAGFQTTYPLVRDAGIDATSLHLPWDEIEKSPGVFAPDPDYLSIASGFYPQDGIAVSMTLAVLDTVASRLPPDLAGLPFDDPRVIERFAAFVEWAAETSGPLQVPVVAVGNEVDVYLAQTGEWAAYLRFLEAVVPRVRDAFPNALVGTKTTHAGLVGPFADEVRRLHSTGDAVLLTHYAIDEDYSAREPGSVHGVFDAAVAAAGGLPVVFSELGYPSSEDLGGTEARQSAFVEATFAAWDSYPSQIPLVEFTWSSDESGEALDRYRVYYGIDDDRFLEYLGSIGFIRTDGSPKPALETLAVEIARRSR